MGRPAARYAPECGRESELRFLLACRVPGAKDLAKCLYDAVRFGTAGCVRALLDAGAPVFAALSEGETPLAHLIVYVSWHRFFVPRSGGRLLRPEARREQLASARLVLEHGADPRAKTKWGESLLGQCSSDAEWTALLREFGGAAAPAGGD